MMGQAKKREKTNERNIIDVLKASRRFGQIHKFDPFTSHIDNKLHSIKAYQHLMDLIFVRAKHLHKSLLREIKKNNSYVSFVLLKAYWENVAMLGYIFVTTKNLMKNKDYEGVLTLVIKHALGGKNFVTDEMLNRAGTTKETFTQTNLITWMQKMDKDFDKEAAGGRKFSNFEKIYNEFIAECGHSTFLGLNICEEKGVDGSIKISGSKTSQFNDDKMTLNNLALADNYFFYYWNKHKKLLSDWLGESG